MTWAYSAWASCPDVGDLWSTCDCCEGCTPSGCVFVLLTEWLLSSMRLLSLFAVTHEDMLSQRKPECVCSGWRWTPLKYYYGLQDFTSSLSWGTKTDEERLTSSCCLGVTGFNSGFWMYTGSWFCVRLKTKLFKQHLLIRAVRASSLHRHWKSSKSQHKKFKCYNSTIKLLWPTMIMSNVKTSSLTWERIWM